MNKLNIVLLEPTTDFHADLKEHYRRFFRLAGYESEFFCVNNERELRDKLQGEVVDVIIADLLLLTEDFAGLVVVQSTKKDYPDVLCIGNSRADVGYRQTASKLPTFDMFIEKGALFGRDKVYLDSMVQEFLAKFKRNTGVEIDAGSRLPGELERPKGRRDLISLLSQVTFSSHQQDTLVNGTKILLTPLSGGRSKSHVFKMIPQNPVSQLSGVPAVLKISERSYAEQELDNYNRFVKWVLPYAWRVDLLGVGFTKSYGAICYSFILSGYEDFDSLTHFISEGKKDAIKGALSKIFDPRMRQWYSDKLIQVQDNINERYMQRYFLGGSAKDQVSPIFASCCQEIFGNTIIGKSYTKVFGRKYPLPVDRLFGQPNGPYQSCICHGDMNSNNVILAKNGEVIFIDFQYTGRGHVFEDFVTMEASIRILYNDADAANKGSTPWEQVIEDETRVDDASAYNSLPPHYQLIADVRSMARANFSTERLASYYYGVAAFNCRLLRITTLSSWQKGRILAAILVALRKLDEHSK